MADVCPACWTDATAAFANPAVLGRGLENSWTVFASAAGDNNALAFSQAIRLFSGGAGGAAAPEVPPEGVWGRWTGALGAGAAYGPAMISAAVHARREDQGLSSDALRPAAGDFSFASDLEVRLKGVSRTHATVSYGLTYGREIPITAPGWQILVGSTVRVVRGASLSEYKFDVDSFRQDSATGAATSNGANRVIHTQAADAAGWGLDLGALVSAPRGATFSFHVENLWSETRWLDAHVWTACLEPGASGPRLCEERADPVTPTPEPGKPPAPPRATPACACLQALSDFPNGNPEPSEDCTTRQGCRTMTVHQVNRPILRHSLSWQHPNWRAFDGAVGIGLDADTGERGVGGDPRHKQYRFRIGAQAGWRSFRFRVGYVSRFAYHDLAPERHEGGDLHLGLGWERPFAAVEASVTTAEKLRADSRAPSLGLGFLSRF